MTHSTLQTFSDFETQKNEDPMLVAMVYQNGFENISAGLSNDSGIIGDDGGFSKIAFVLVLSFISIVTISRRPTQG